MPSSVSVLGSGGHAALASAGPPYTASNSHSQHRELHGLTVAAFILTCHTGFACRLQQCCMRMQISAGTCVVLLTETMAGGGGQNLRALPCNACCGSGNPSAAVSSSSTQVSAATAPAAGNVLNVGGLGVEWEEIRAAEHHAQSPSLVQL
jgi:hypothetical protein